jgi:hypothetical protein
MDDLQEDPPADDEAIAPGVRHLLPEEEAAGSEDPEAQSAAILEDSAARSDATVTPRRPVEHRTSDEATEPVDGT